MATTIRKHGKRALLAAALMSLAAPVAFAGPEQDTEQAEKEFARGNLVGAMPLWLKAAEQGYAPAQVRLGDILDKTEEDEQAVSWYRKAAEQGNAAGEFGLGHMYAIGEGVKQDFEQARKYFGRAAEKDYLPAVAAMIEMYKSGSLGMAIDLEQSAKWVLKEKELAAKEAAAKSATAATATTATTK